MIYRAKVDAVNGLNVRAGGKWLICIGNKPVSVGDFVWTDGRCVYGNERVSSQPIVITASSKREPEIIPYVSYPGQWAHFDMKSSELTEDGVANLKSHPELRQVKVLPRGSRVSFLHHEKWAGYYDNVIPFVAYSQDGAMTTDLTLLADTDVDADGNVFTLFTNCKVYRNNEEIAYFLEPLGAEIDQYWVSCYRRYSALYARHGGEDKLYSETADDISRSIDHYIKERESWNDIVRFTRRHRYEFIHPFVQSNGDFGTMLAWGSVMGVYSVLDHSYFGGCGALLFVHNGDIQTVSNRFYINDTLYMEEPYTVIDEGFSFVPHSIKIPMQDGGYYTFALDKSTLNRLMLGQTRLSSFKHHSEIKFYDSNDNLQFTLKGTNAQTISLKSTLNVQPLTNGHFLLLEALNRNTGIYVSVIPDVGYGIVDYNIGYDVYYVPYARLWTYDSSNDTLTLISNKVANHRLYSMKPNRWRKTINKYKE